MICKNKQVIVAGNDFKLRITLTHYDGGYVPLDLTTCTDLHVLLLSNVETDLKYEIDQEQTNILTATVDYRLVRPNTGYGIAVEGRDENDKHFRWEMRPSEGFYVSTATSSMCTGDDIYTVDLAGRVGWGDPGYSKKEIDDKIKAVEDDIDEVDGDVSILSNDVESLQTTVSGLGEDVELLQSQMAGKQDTLTAGENITIDANNVISAVGGGSTYTAGNGIDITNDTISVDTTVVATQNDLSGKQDTLTAGANITITNNEISATDTVYTAGTNITISANNEISATDTTYTAGNGIDITNDVISVITPEPEPDYATMPLTIDIYENDTVFNYTYAGSELLYFSYNGGEWQSLEPSIQGGATYSRIVHQGDTLAIKMDRTANYVENVLVILNFSKTFGAKGNAMSMLFGDNFIGQTDLTGYNYALANLFAGSPIVDADKLLLPATTLSTYCYKAMFNGCSSLVKAPELPATSLTPNCYYMMFNACTSLTKAPKLAATTLGIQCYYQMFGYCSSLTEAPELPAIELKTQCYDTMFKDCTSLTKAPELPATTLSSKCYANMFSRCTALVEAPELPALTLATSCYQGMFSGCTSLIKAPELPATTLYDSCYKYMFQGCTSLNYIKCLASGSNFSAATFWVSSVSATGTFIKNTEATWTTTGISGVPTGWTVEYATPDTIIKEVNTSNLPVTSAAIKDYVDQHGGSSYTAGNGIDITNDTISLEHNIVPLTQSQYNALERSQQLDATAIYFIHPEAATFNIESATDASTGSDIDMWVSEQMTIDGVTRTVWHQAALNTYGYGSTYNINDQKCYIKFRNLKSLTIKARLTPISDAGLCSYNYPYYSQVDQHVDTSNVQYGDDNTNNKWCGYDYSSNDWHTITYNDLEIDDQWHTIEVDHKVGLNGNPAYYSYTNDQFFIYDDALYNYNPSSYNLTEYDWMHLVGVSTQYAQDGSPLGPSFELGSYSIFSPIKSTVKWTNDCLVQVAGGNLLGSRRHQMDTLSIFQYANGVYCDYGPYETELGNGYRVILYDNITDYEDIYTYQMWINSVDHTGHLMNYDTGVQVNGSACDYTTPMTVYAYPQCENSTIYNIQIMATDNSRIVANWVPCKNSSDVPCWFDTKTGTIANMTVQDAGLTITLGND